LVIAFGAVEREGFGFFAAGAVEVLSVAAAESEVGLDFELEVVVFGPGVLLSVSTSSSELNERIFFAFFFFFSGRASCESSGVGSGVLYLDY
jgi:hypothetical protein